MIPMQNTTTLRYALVFNALFSAGCGILLMVAPWRVATLLGLPPHWLFPIVGACLLLFATELVRQVTLRRVSTWRALLSSMADLLWVAGSVIAIWLHADALSSKGIAVVVSVAAVVLTFALAQLAGIDRFHRAGRAGMFRHCVAVRSNASAESMWEIIRDIASIDRYSASLESSEVVGGGRAEVGAVRRCIDTGGRRWAEQVTALDPGRSLDLRFLAEAPDFPYPFSEMTGGWRILPRAPGCEVEIWWEFTPKQRWLVPFLLPVMTFSIDRELVRVVRNMTRRALGETEPNDRSVSARVSRIPRLC